MKVYIVIGKYDQICGVFAKREDAEESFSGPDDVIEEQEVYESPLPKWSYWHYGASVYPDGTYEEWAQEHSAEGVVGIPPCDDHLNNREEPWDGHLQGHCGEHISIFGTDQKMVQEAFAKHLATSIARQNGVCHSPSGHGGADGVTTYQMRFGGKVRRSTLAEV